ncbi:MAG: hypothetical protein IPH28_05880 [Cytophagaceae bacterium]|nr:hypothetical protein [Cytophagaceae bacterium]
MKKSFKISVYSFLAFLFFSLFEVYGWRFNFWFIRITFILFLSSFIAAFVYSGKKTSIDITKSFGWASIGYFLVSAIIVAIGGVFLSGILALMLLPIIGPRTQSSNDNFKIQIPYRGFMRMAGSYQLVEDRFLIFEKKIFYFGSDSEIKTFSFNPNSNILILLPQKDTIDFNKIYKLK